MKQIAGRFEFDWLDPISENYHTESFYTERYCTWMTFGPWDDIQNANIAHSLTFNVHIRWQYAYNTVQHHMMCFKSCLVFNLSSSALHLVDDVFVVTDVVLEVHQWFPGVMLAVDAAAGGFNVLMACHSQRIPADKVFMFLITLWPKPWQTLMLQELLSHSEPYALPQGLPSTPLSLFPCLRLWANISWL